MLLNICWSIIKALTKDRGERPDEEAHVARPTIALSTGPSVSIELGCCPPPDALTNQNLSEPHHLVFLMAVSRHWHRWLNCWQLLIELHFQPLCFPQRLVVGWGWRFQTSEHVVVPLVTSHLLELPHSCRLRCLWKGLLWVTEILLSPFSLRKFRGSRKL